MILESKATAGEAIEKLFGRMMQRQNNFLIILSLGQKIVLPVIVLHCTL